MPSIDEKVVSLKFDDNDFARKVESTKRNVEQLEQSLSFKGAGDGLQKITKAAKGVDLSPIASSAEMVMGRFNALDAIAFSVIHNITTGVMNAAKKLATAIPRQIWTGGWSRAANLEQAKFQIEGLKASWDDLYKDISYAVDGTAYGLDAAAKVASQLTASGIQAGDQMKQSLRAISGVAAMTNSSYEDIGRVFTTVAGNGRLMGEQLLQLSSRGINAAATLAKALNKSEAEVRDMVSKGEIDFNTFAEAMNEAFGEHATAANETFSGALSNVKSALSRIGAEIATPLRQNMIPVFNSLRLMINAIKSSLSPIFEDISQSFEFMSKHAVTAIDAITGHMNNKKFITFDDWKKAGEVSEEFKNAIISAAEAHDVAVSDMIAEEGSFEKTLKNGWLSKDILDEAVESMGGLSSQSDDVRASFNAMNDALASTDKMASLELLIGVFEKFLDVALRLGSVVKDAFTNVFDFNISGDSIRDFIKSIYDMADGFKLSGETVRFVREIFEGWFSLLHISGTGAIAVWQLFYTVFSSMADALSPLGRLIGDVLLGFSDLAQSLDTTISRSEWLKGTFSGLLATIKAFSSGVKSSISEFVDSVEASGAIDNFFHKVKEFASDVAPKFVLAVNHMATIGGKVLNVFSVIGSGLSKVFGSSNSAFVEFAPGLENLANTMQNTGSVIASFLDFISSVFAAFFNVLSAGIDRFSGFGSSFNSATEKVSDASETLSEKVGPAAHAIDKLRSVIDKIRGMLPSFESSGNGLKNFSDMLANVGAAIGNFVASLDFGQVIDVAIKVIDEIFKIMLAISTKKGIDTAADTMKSLGKGLNGFLGSLSGLVNSKNRNLTGLPAMVNSITAAMDKMSKQLIPGKLMAIAFAIGVLSVALFLLASLDPVSLAKALTAVAIGLGVLIGAMVLMDKALSGSSMKGMFSMAVTMVALAGAMILFAIAVKLLDSVDWDAIGKAGAVLAGVVAAMYGLTKIGKGAIRSAISLQALAVALTMLVVPIMLIGRMKFETLVQGLMGIAGALGVTIGALAVMSKVHAGKAVVQLFGVAIALTALIKPIKELGSMDVISLVQGLGGVAAALFILVAVLAAMKNRDLNAAVMQLSVVAGVITILSKAVQELGSMSLEDMIQGLAGIGVSIFILVGALAVMQKLKLSSAVVGLAGLAAVLMQLVIPITIFGSMSTESLARGIIGIAGSLGVLIIAMAAMKNMKMTTAAIELFAIAKALLVLMIPIKMLGEMNPWDLAQGIGGLTAALIAVLAPMSAFMILMNRTSAFASVKMGSMLLMFLGVSVAIMALAKALEILAGIPAQQLAAGLIALGVGLAVVIGAMYIAGMLATTLAPGVLVLLAFGVAIGLAGAGIFLFATGLEALIIAAASLGAALTTVVTALNSQIDPIMELAANALRSLGEKIGPVLAELGGKIVEFLKETFMNTSKSISEDAPVLIDAFTQMVTSLADAIAPKIPIFIEKGVEILTALMSGLESKASDLATSALSLVTALINAIADAIEGHGVELRDACDHLVQSIIDFIIEFITGKEQVVDENGKTIGQNIMDGIRNGINEFLDHPLQAIEEFVTSLIDRAKGLLGIASPSTVFESIGGDLMAGLKNGIESFTSDPIGAVETLATNLVDTVKNTPIGQAAETVVGNLSSAFEAVRQDPVAAVSSGLSMIQSSVSSFAAPIATAGAGVIGSLSSSLRAGSGEASGSASAVMTGVTGVVSNSRAAIATAGTAAMSGYVNAISSKVGAARAAITSMISAMRASLNSAVSAFRSAASRAVSSYASGIRSGAGSARFAGSSVASAGVSGASGYYWSFYNIGANLGQGLVNGLNSKYYDVSSAAARLARVAADAAKRASDERSPSKVWAKIGAYMSEGMVIGMLSLKGQVDSAGSEISKTALPSILGAQSLIRDAVSSDFEMKPKITPVVDLNSVKGAGSYIQGVFGQAYGIGSDISLANYGLYGSQSGEKSNSIVNNVSVTVQYQAGSDVNAFASNLASVLTAKMNLEA